MKYIIPLLLLVAIASCTKKGNPTPNNPMIPLDSTNSFDSISTMAHFIPNWQYDTLISMVMPPDSTPYFDTIYADNINDTSVFYYHGVKYYIWTISLSLHGQDEYKNGEQVYGNCLISLYPKPDVSKGFSYNLMNIANPYKYYSDSYNNWTPMYQGIQFVTKPPFPQYSYSYSTMNKF